MNYYSSFQPSIDLPSTTELNQFIKIQHFGLNTKAIIRDNTRQIRSECRDIYHLQYINLTVSMVTWYKVQYLSVCQF